MQSWPVTTRPRPRKQIDWWAGGRGLCDGVTEHGRVQRCTMTSTAFPTSTWTNDKRGTLRIAFSSWAITWRMGPAELCNQRMADILSFWSPMMDTFTLAFPKSGDTSTSTMDIMWRRRS
eukprot:scaffold10537_cov122-Isochrysis_galbana.AAC.17